LTDNKELEALDALMKILPPEMREGLMKAIYGGLGAENISAVITNAETTDAPPYKEAVDELLPKIPRGHEMIATAIKFLDGLRVEGKDFAQCWAAMCMVAEMAATREQLIEMYAFTTTALAFDRKPQVETKQSDSGLDIAKILADMEKDLQGGDA